MAWNWRLPLSDASTKRGNESIVFQCATYKASPNEHVEAYDARWYIEKCIRTTKQKLGLQDCFSRSLQVQHSHVAAVLLADSLAQLQMKKHKLKNPEEAIRRFKKENTGVPYLNFHEWIRSLDNQCGSPVA